MYQTLGKAVRQTKFVKTTVAEIVKKSYEAIRQKNEQEMQERIKMVELAAKRAKLREERIQKEEYETYLRLKSKFEPQEA